MNKQDYSQCTFSELKSRVNELLKDIRDTDAKNLPLDELMGEMDRAMSMLDLLMHQHHGTEFYDEYWGSRQIKDEPPVLPPDQRPEAERIDIPRRLKIIATIGFRKNYLREHAKASVGDEALLKLQLDELGCAAGEPDILFNEPWEQHELHWHAHQAELRRRLVRQSAHIMLAFEDIQRKDPNHFDNDPKMQQMLHWWCNEGGREEYLGEITLEERRDLEEKARQWRERDE